jgi:hypothetical protein
LKRCGGWSLVLFCRHFWPSPPIYGNHDNEIKFLLPLLPHFFMAPTKSTKVKAASKAASKPSGASKALTVLVSPFSSFFFEILQTQFRFLMPLPRGTR